MKTKLVLFALVSAFSLQPSALFSQGSLTPPGAPAPTMKTLDQIEARTPVSSAPFAITASGSYYLTTNITVSFNDAITIYASDVTLDLNGFTVASTASSPSGIGIMLSGNLKNITIRNGHIRGGVTNNGSGVYSGSGFWHGISYVSDVLENIRVTGVSVSGCLYNGIFLGLTTNFTVVEACTVSTVGNYGIYAGSVSDSTVKDCGDNAIIAKTAQNCSGYSSGNGRGLEAYTAQNCYGIGAGSGDGINAQLALNCYGSSGSGYGLYASCAQNCYGSSAVGFGLGATSAQNCSGICSGSSFGLYATVASNCYGNSSSGTGLGASQANTCYGVSASGMGLTADYANFCFGTTVSAGIKYNMP